MTKPPNGDPTRRTLLRQMTVGAAVIGWSAASGSWVTADADAAGVAPPPPLDGTLTTSPDVLARFSKDFGHLVTGVPRAVLRPGSVDDIVAMVRYTRANGLKIAMNGQGLSADGPESSSIYGQSQVPGGISIDAKGLSTIHDIRADSAWVDAGVTWAQLIDAALAQGKMPPAHPGYQHLSVGGTASVGGIGPQVSKYGLLIDTISEIEIVTGRGDLHRASATKLPDLFYAALGGGGQAGIITKARVKLVPAPERVAVFSLYYDDPGIFQADQEMLVRDGRFPAQGGLPVRNADDTAWQYRIDAVYYYDPPNSPDRAALLAGLHDNRGSAQFADLGVREWVFRLDPLAAGWLQGGYWDQPKPWLSMVIPGSKVAEFSQAVLAELTSDGVGAGIVQLFAFTTAKLTRPLFKVPNEPVVYLFDLLRVPPPGDPEIAAMLAQNRRIYDFGVSLGAKRYIIGAVPDMSTQDWRNHFGTEWDRLLDAKRRYDPDHILTPGAGFFS